MTEKPRAKPPAVPPEHGDAGHLGMDDRGNVTWQWNEQVDRLPDDTFGSTQRIRALVDPGLEVADDDSDPLQPRRDNAKGLKTGYNPYNSGTLGTRPRGKKKDLKQLSQWIELRKKVTKGKDGA